MKTKILITLSVIMLAISSIMSYMSRQEEAKQMAKQLQQLSDDARYHCQTVQDKLELRLGTIERNLDSINFVFGLKKEEEE